MIPWILFAVVVVPLVIVAYVILRRRTRKAEYPVSSDASAPTLTEREFSEAEAYEARWHEQDKERFHRERLP